LESSSVHYKGHNLDTLPRTRGETINSIEIVLL